MFGLDTKHHVALLKSREKSQEGRKIQKVKSDLHWKEGPPFY